MIRARFLSLLTLTPALFGAAGCSLAVPRSNAGIALFEQAPAPVGPCSIAAKYAGWAAGAPAAVALAPIAAAAWATPWVDLADVEDVLTAPGLALGYASEATVGALAYAALLWLDDDPGPRSAPAPEIERGPVPCGFVVSHAPMALAPRPAEPLPASLSALYAVDPRAVDRLSAALDEAARRTDAGETVAVPIGADPAISLE